MYIAHELLDSDTKIWNTNEILLYTSSTIATLKLNGAISTSKKIQSRNFLIASCILQINSCSSNIARTL